MTMVVHLLGDPKEYNFKEVKTRLSTYYYLFQSLLHLGML